MTTQEMFDNFTKASTAERMKTSKQFSLIELILRLENVKGKTKYVCFDDANYVPINVDSWRGSYADLAISYDDSGTQPKNVSTWIALLQECIGKTFEGYKGGDFVMGKNTPIWVANYGESSGFKRADGLYYQAVVGITETDDSVVLMTEAMDT